MTWPVSRFHTGVIIEVRSKEEILATLDEHGRLEGMPFMPEMLRFCGRRFRVSAVAHKTCETARGTWSARRLNSAVHLDGLRCDGSAHGGCQASCNLFWKDEWLKPVRPASVPGNAATPERTALNECTETQLFAKTVQSCDPNGTPYYSCQITDLYEATLPLAWWDPRQYARDVLTGNHSLGHVIRVLWLACLKCALDHTPSGYRALVWMRTKMHRWMIGRDVPDFSGVIPRGRATPTSRLDLKPGERVRIKTKGEIMQTVDHRGCNRGLAFDVELTPYCGQTATVRTSVEKIIDERTGQMRHMKQPCIILEDVFCKAEYSKCRLLCPRAIPPYWHEIWLERMDEPVADT